MLNLQDLTRASISTHIGSQSYSKGFGAMPDECEEAVQDWTLEISSVSGTTTCSDV